MSSPKPRSTVGTRIDHAGPSLVSIPQHGLDMNPDLGLLRLEIDKIDGQIVALIAQRFAVIDRVAVLKAAKQIPARIQSRIDAVIQRREAAGRGLGLPRRTAANIWKVIVEEACKHEERSIEEHLRDNKL